MRTLFSPYLHVFNCTVATEIIAVRNQCEQIKSIYQVMIRGTRSKRETPPAPLKKKADCPTGCLFLHPLHRRQTFFLGWPYQCFHLCRLGKFTSISGRQRTTKIQNLVVHKYLWSSSSVFLLQNSKKIGKIGIFFNDDISKIQ